MVTKKQQILDQIRADIVSKNVCSDLAKEATNLVMGHGSSDAQIIFIGEAPGKQEDEQGKPFVGASGKFLDSMLESIGLNRKDIYITNIVKYRPPNNRDPSAEEKADFMPYLKQEIQTIKPKIIVTLGRHSMDFFLPGQKISKIHGQAFKVSLDRSEILVMPLYHPAAALYNGSLRKTLEQDFIQIKKLINLTK